MPFPVITATSSPLTANPGEIEVRSVQAQSLNTGDAGTTQDFTVSGFGTPTAWVVTVCYGTTNTTIRANSGMSVGFSDGAIERYVYFGAEDGQSTAYASSDTGSSRVARMLTPGTTSVELNATSATTTNGITLTYTTKPATRMLITVDLISCDDAVVDLSTGSPETFGFEPTCILTLHANGISSPRNGWRGGLGFAAQTTGGTITQGAMSQRFEIGTNAPVTIGQLNRTSSFVSSLSGTHVESTRTLTSFDSGGFTFSTSGLAPSFSYLALRAATTSFWTGWTATGTTAPATQSVTTPGFGCAGGWLVSTFLDALDTLEDFDDNCSTGFHSWNSMEQFSSSTSLQDGSTPEAAAFSRGSTDGFDVLDDLGALAIESSVAGSSGGFELDLTTTDGTGRYFLALVFQAGTLYEAIEEVVGVTEQALGAAFQAIAEGVDITEEDGSLMVASPPMELSMEGESGGPDVVQGESGGPSVEEGDA